MSCNGSLKHCSSLDHCCCSHSSHRPSSEMSQMICQSLIMWLLTDWPLVSITVSACAHHISNCVSYSVRMCECESLLELIVLLMIYILTLPSITACEDMCESASHTLRFFHACLLCTWEFSFRCRPLFIAIVHYLADLYIWLILRKHLCLQF